jgi:hypothetical protein
LTSDFKDEFQRLCVSKNPEKRGLAFEKLFCRFLFKSGFEVLRNPAAVEPRQTDLLAEYGGDTFLFEMKWVERNLGLEAIAQIKDRLGRTTKDTIGCICSVSGFTESLIKDIEAHRPQFEILLFNPFEIHGLLTERISIVDLIDRKRRALKQDGQMWFFGQDPPNSKNRYVEMPPAHESLGLPGFSIPLRLQSEHISDILFARTPLIFDEYICAASLRIRLRSSTISELREVLIAAENNLGLRGTGTFGIRQRASGWYGLGSGNFIKEIARHAKRYKNYPYHIHHSEELAFFDEINGGGLFLLTARQSMTRKGWINTGEVIVRLPGIPANTVPYQRFIRSVTTDNLFFSPEQPLRRHHTWLPSSVRVELHDLITTIGSKEFRPHSRSKGCISGVVVKNPFFGKPEKIAAFSDDKELRAFSEPEQLICMLDHWLDVGDEVDHYFLTGLETVALGQAVLLHPRCTWGDLTKRARPLGRSTGLRELQREWNRRDKMLEQIESDSERRKLP